MSPPSAAKGAVGEAAARLGEQTCEDKQEDPDHRVQQGAGRHRKIVVGEEVNTNGEWKARVCGGQPQKQEI